MTRGLDTPSSGVPDTVQPPGTEAADCMATPQPGPGVEGVSLLERFRAEIVNIESKLAAGELTAAQALEQKRRVVAAEEQLLKVCT